MPLGPEKEQLDTEIDRATSHLAWLSDTITLVTLRELDPSLVTLQNSPWPSFMVDVEWNRNSA